MPKSVIHPASPIQQNLISSLRTSNLDHLGFFFSSLTPPTAFELNARGHTHKSSVQTFDEANRFELTYPAVEWQWHAELIQLGANMCQLLSAITGHRKHTILWYHKTPDGPVCVKAFGCIYIIIYILYIYIICMYAKEYICFGVKKTGQERLISCEELLWSKVRASERGRALLAPLTPCEVCSNFAWSL